MSLPLQKHESFIQEGNGASSAVFTAVNAGLYRAYLSSTFNAASTMSGSITQAGSATPSISTPSLSAAQTHVDINQLFTMAIGDTLTFVISSTDPTNSVKSLFNVIQTNSGI